MLPGRRIPRRSVARDRRGAAKPSHPHVTVAQNDVLSAPGEGRDSRRHPIAKRPGRTRVPERSDIVVQSQEGEMAQTVADVLVGVLEQIGVKHIFGLIGNSLNPLADAVRRSSIEWIGVRHEEGAALAAAGPGQAHRPARRLRGHHRSRQHPPGRRPLRSQPRPRAGAGALGRHAAQVAGHRLHPDDRARSAVPRCFALHRDHRLAGPGAGA